MADSAAVERWKNKAMAEQRRNRTLREVAGQTGETFAMAAESGITAATMGYMQGKGMKHLGPVPLDLGVGVAGLLAGVYLDGALGTHAERIGIGSFNAYLTSVGQGMGAAAKAKEDAAKK